MSKTTESALEETALTWFENLGYTVKFGPDIAFDDFKPENTGRHVNLEN
ncbi:hypothetical protein KJ762_15720 [bacterium]|nr:hypothetical protein [bacterium]MBU1635933.1 hypothetical protein [bacterium]MBU1874090.1 hypothetical protein [bacterium]